MAKAKSKAAAAVADGKGGMVEVTDHRFEQDDWPLKFKVPADQADRWLRYFDAECERRNWSSTSFGQMEAQENSGSITVRSTNAEMLTVTWERRRARAISVRARPGVGCSSIEAQEFFKRVNARCASGETERFYRRGFLQYEGLAWRGEVWLDSSLRLGPPSRQDETAQFGPRYVVVDALVDAAGQMDAGSIFQQMLEELSVFLSVAL